jgi:uncharacterized protein
MSSMLRFVLEPGQKKSYTEEIVFENDGVNAQGVANVELEYAEYGIDISIDFEADVHLTCSRCAKKYTDKQHINHQIILAETEKSWEIDDETLEMNVISLENSTLNLYELLRQLLIENQEINPLCYEECEGLCAKCGADLNIEQCDCKTEDEDPRWAKLKSLQLSKEEV